MSVPQVLLLSGGEVSALLPPSLSLSAVEAAMRELAGGSGPPPGVLGLRLADGGFHVKAAALSTPSPYYAAKINANFPANPQQRGLPTIQGVLALFDATSGVLLALMDSIRITALRTAAATALAARHLARRDASSLLVIGCGTQASYQVRALRDVLPIARVEAHDIQPARATALVQELALERIPATVADDLASAARRADVVVTCTTSPRPLLGLAEITPGTFVAAVGADNEHKLEIEPSLMRSARVVVDVLEQCATIGDLRGAIAAGLMTRDDVHAELPELVSGRRPGREWDEQVFIFDSTGSAVQDVAAAGAVYQQALERGAGARITLAS